MKMSKRKLTYGALLFVWAYGGLPAPVWAQPVSEQAVEQTIDETTLEPATDETTVWQLEGITVTARRSEENAKNIPFTINIIGGSEAAERRLASLEEALGQVPGLEINSFNDTFNTAVKMRGVGALQKLSLDDSSVTFSIDGIPQSALSAMLNIMDIERVEVLKGPQGTLFGRNSEAGAINIVTRKPTQHVEGYFRTEFGEEKQRMVEGALSGPLADKLSGRIAARWRSSDNTIINDADGKPLSEPRQIAVRGTLLWQPTDTTDVTLTIKHDKDNDRPGAVMLRPYGDPPRVYLTPGKTDSDKTSDGYGLKIEQTLKNSVFTSSTGYSDTEYKSSDNFYEGYLYEALYGIRPDAFRTYAGHEKVFNQEFRLSSKPEDPIFWVAGVNYLHSNRTHNTRDAYDNFYPDNPFNARIDRRFKVESKAIFGEVTYPIAERLKLTGGLRQSWEKKTYDATWQANPDNPSVIRLATDNQELNENFTTGRIALSYELSPKVNLYTIYSRGHKTGGFNDNDTMIAYGVPTTPYRPTKINSYEVGFKSTLGDSRLTLNGAYFYNDNKNDHLWVFDPMTFSSTAENFDTRSKGAELELNWLAGNGFTLGAGVSYIDAKIVSVPAGSASGATAGNRVPDSAKWSTVLSIGHEKAVGDVLGLRNATLRTRITDRFVGSRAADPQNNFDLDSYHKVDVHIGLATASREVYLWVDNLLDERYDYYGYFYGTGFTVGTPSRGRTVGLGMVTYF